MSKRQVDRECSLRRARPHSPIETVPDIIIYRGEEIPVASQRKLWQGAKKQDGSPWFTEEQLDRELQRWILREKQYIGRLTGARYEKHSGYRLAFYEREHQLFPEAYKQKVDDKTAESLVKKLARHFLGRRANSIHVRFWGNHQSGAKGFWGNIRLSHNPSIGLVCHETAHLRFEKHDKRLMGMMKRMIAYCQKKGWFREEASV